MFVAVGRKLLNLDQVREIEVHAGEQTKLLAVTFNDGSVGKYEVPSIFDETMLSNCIIPAPPGYFQVRYAPPDDLNYNSSTGKDPIVAFQVDRNYLRPILLDGFADDKDNTAILRPDGKVDGVFDRVFDDVDAFKEYKDAERIKKR